VAIWEILRERVVSDLLEMNTMQECWPVWSVAIRAGMGPSPTSSVLLKDIGPRLAEIFASTGEERTQSSQSGGGAVWEALVCWYLNFCLIGTRTVVIKKARHVPDCIKEALTVTYGNVKTNSESDLIAITFPDDDLLKNLVSMPCSGRRFNQINDHIAFLFERIEVCVIQCKTNWNENAQIPMLWDMIYSATGFDKIRASVGVNGRGVRSLSKFCYAFVTVPTNGVVKFNPNSTPVLRLNGLSGGNFWGHPGRKGVAGSIADIFNKNFQTAINGVGEPWPKFLTGELMEIESKYAYFKV